MKPAERIWILVARKLSGEACAYDIAELEELLKKNPEFSYSVQLLIDLWNSTGAASIRTEWNFAKQIKRFDKN